VTAVRQAVAIDLETVTQTGLHDPLAVLDLFDEPRDVADQVDVDALDVTGDDRAEQQAAEPRGGIDRQARGSERHPPGGHGRARVEDLELRQQHDRRRYRPVGSGEITSRRWEAGGSDSASTITRRADDGAQLFGCRR
jgi:hypothetical protein